MFGLVELMLSLCYAGFSFGGGGPILLFCLSISSSWVNLRLHTENQLYTLPGSALKVCVVVGGGGGCGK